MIPFSYNPRTKLEYGPHKAISAGEYIAPLGFRKILVVVGQHSFENSPHKDAILASLEGHGIEYSILKGIRPNPELESVYKGANLIKEEGFDGILAIGGGSVMDAAKAMAIATYYDGDYMDLALGKAIPTKAVPVICIPTLAASGSEASDSVVISDDKRNLKKGLHSDLVRPVLSIIDPVMTIGAPRRVMAAGAIDTMMHSIERFLDDSYPYQISDDWALDVIKNVKKALDTSTENPDDLEARGALCLLSTLSHNGLTSLGKKGTFLVHPLQQAIGGFVPSMSHAEGVGVLLIGYWEHRKTSEKGKLAKLANALFDISIENEESCSIMGVARYREYLASLGLPTTLRGLGATESDVQGALRYFASLGTRAIGYGKRSLCEADIREIYRLAY